MLSAGHHSDLDKNVINNEKPEDDDDKLTRRKYDFLYKRTCFRLMVDFFKNLFQTMFKGKKVSRNYQKYMDEFAESHFGNSAPSKYNLVLPNEAVRR